MTSLTELLTEKLIVLGKKAYPSSGNIVIMAGGSASGKGTIINNLLGMEGKVLDVDELKELILRSKKFHALVREKFGVEVSSLNLRTPNDVYLLHDIVKKLDLPNKKNSALYTSILSQTEKPNLIFDVTLQDFSKLQTISNNAHKFGYDKSNIHIVWVINELSASLQYNKKRGRVVPDEVVVGTHVGVSLTMKQITKMGARLQNYMDGDIVFVFNKIGLDSEQKFSEHGGSFFVKSDYIKIKRQNESVDEKLLTNQVKQKIMEYIPEIDW